MDEDPRMPRCALPSTTPRQLLAIIEACRQTYSEAKWLPFTVNTFEGDIERWNAAINTYKYLNTDYLKALGTVRLYTETWNLREDLEFIGSASVQPEFTALLRTFAEIPVRMLYLWVSMYPSDKTGRKYQVIIVKDIMKELEKAGYNSEWKINATHTTVLSTDGDISLTLARAEM